MISESLTRKSKGGRNRGEESGDGGQKGEERRGQGTWPLYLPFIDHKAISTNKDLRHFALSPCFLLAPRDGLESRS